MSLTYKQDNSLVDLTKKFITMINKAPDKQIDLKIAESQLKV